MFLYSAFDVLKRINNHSIAIVGAGKSGTELVEFLLFNGITVDCFFDNNPFLWKKHNHGVPIVEMEKIEGIKYVISTGASYRKELVKQLSELNINGDDIIIYYPTPHDRDFIVNYGRAGLENAISQLFRNTFGFDMDWDEPKTYNEKINWEKARVSDERMTMCADKYKVRDYVKEMIGEEYLTKIYGHWSKPEEIDYSILPKSFALKLNNGSARNILIRDKNSINERIIRDTFRNWMSIEWAFTSFEMHYKDIQPVIYCEELLDGAEEEGFCDYKVFCFNGEVKFIQRIRFEHTERAVGLFYDKQWNRQPFNQYYADDKEVEKPEFINEMIINSEKLARNFKHVRVDWFVTAQGKVYFGEMTFANWSGLERFSPEDYDRILGDMIQL